MHGDVLGRSDGAEVGGMRKEGRDDLHLNLCRMNYVLRLFVPSGPVSYGATNLAFLKSDGTKLPGPTISV